MCITCYLFQQKLVTDQAWKLRTYDANQKNMFLEGRNQLQNKNLKKKKGSNAICSSFREARLCYTIYLSIRK